MRYKYRYVRTECKQGHKHNSKKEAKRCDELTMLESGGRIRNLVQQPIFVLQESFKFNGKSVRSITYRADFSYYNNDINKFCVEDTKGFKTTDYIIKSKWFMFKMRDAEDFSFIES